MRLRRNRRYVNTHPIQPPLRCKLKLRQWTRSSNRRNSASGIENSVEPQFKQTESFGNTITAPLAKPSDPPGDECFLGFGDARAAFAYLSRAAQPCMLRDSSGHRGRGGWIHHLHESSSASITSAAAFCARTSSSASGTMNSAKLQCKQTTSFGNTTRWVCPDLGVRGSEGQFRR